MDRSYRFEDDGSVVTLIYKHDGDGMERPYYISKSTLGDVREERISDWVMQLLDKTWNTKSMLYDLAKIIQNAHPNNSIDWYSTFSIVESSFLHDYENNKIENANAEPLDFFDEIRINRERVEDKKFQDEVKKRVIEGLNHYGLDKKLDVI